MCPSYQFLIFVLFRGETTQPAELSDVAKTVNPEEISLDDDDDDDDDSSSDNENEQQGKAYC